MSLIPYRSQKSKGWLDPFSELENIQKQMNQMFDVSLARNPLSDVFFSGGQWMPSIDLCENKDSIIVKADLPGMRRPTSGGEYFHKASGCGGRSVKIVFGDDRTGKIVPGIRRCV